VSASIRHRSWPPNCTDVTRCLEWRKGGPGWYIDQNYHLVQCPAGHYCPFNHTDGTYKTEVGCTNSEICPLGMDRPFNCSWFINCDGYRPLCAPARTPARPHPRCSRGSRASMGGFTP
jgi:hypothetical protein